MQNQQPTTRKQYTPEESQQLQNNLLDNAYPVGNVAQLFMSDAEYLERRAERGQDAFVERTAPLFYYERDLIGVPFVVVTPAQYGTLQDSQFGPREVARLGISIIDLSGPAPRALAPTIAQLSHRYLLNDIRNLTEREFVGGHVWTLARNPAYPLTPQGKYPVTLKIYEFGDRPEVVDSEYPPDNGFTASGQVSGQRAYPTGEQMDAARSRFGLGTARAVPGTLPTTMPSAAHDAGHDAGQSSPRQTYTPWGRPQAARQLPPEAPAEPEAPRRARGRPRLNPAD